MKQRYRNGKQALTTAEFIEQCPYYPMEEVEEWVEYHCERCGVSPVFYPSDIEGIRKFEIVPTQKLREAFIKRVNDPEFYELFAEELVEARKIHGEFGSHDVAPGKVAGYLREALGIQPKEGKVKLLISYEVAEVLCKSLGLRPTDVGV